MLAVQVLDSVDVHDKRTPTMPAQNLRVERPVVFQRRQVRQGQIFIADDRQGPDHHKIGVHTVRDVVAMILQARKITRSSRQYIAGER